jgi:hypothetical protein
MTAREIGSALRSRSRSRRFRARPASPTSPTGTREIGDASCHLGEGLPFLLPRLEHRLDKQREGVGLGNARRKVGQYFSDNFRAVKDALSADKQRLIEISQRRLADS